MKPQLRTVIATFSIAAGILGSGCSNSAGTQGDVAQGGSVPSAGTTATTNTGGTSAGGTTAASSGSPGTSGSATASAGSVGNYAGQSSGGTSSGGTSSGGTSSAGTSSAGASSGGKSSAGASSGGKSSGGSATGGSGGTVNTGGSGGGKTGMVIPSAGCGKSATLTFGTVPNENASATPGGPNQGTGKGGWATITSGGQSRNFALRLPDNYDNSHPYWLVFAFHGNGETAAGMDTGGDNGYFTAYWGLQRESKNGAIFVAPEWSGGGWGTGDLGFTDDMVKAISTNYCVDMSNIITSGFSYGGGMSHALACSRANTNTNPVGYKFRAAVMFEACSFLVDGTCPNHDPIAIWQKAGVTDSTCGFDDSKTVRNWFTDRNACTAWTSETGNVAASTTGTVSTEPPQPPTPGKFINPGGHVCTNYTCSSGPVRWCADQAGHGNATADGTSSLFDQCANVTSQYPHGNCSPGCPCTWTPDDVWTWLKDPTVNKYTPNITAF